jgi:hypothetical protein
MNAKINMEMQMLGGIAVEYLIYWLLLRLVFLILPTLYLQQLSLSVKFMCSVCLL